MIYVPYNVLKTIHEETHSAFPNAPIIPPAPQRPRRHPLRAVRRLLQRRPVQPLPVEPMPVPPQEVPVEPRPAPALVTGAEHELCEAEVRDRGTKVASAARAC
ncbi:hypothetical protein E1218_21330 [Kribbella turkmenica]|uniref:Uncharacterized protein n=1 Tax=Kribbella turkmenica TaxID=2530375 RepID=A0A4R4WU04_9ACTN|nr:hypothetical protein [Kribbella turkmenica]TDD21106.1 hypothetical protein E1218_21330 [Kribbella turkmenica]